MEMVNCALTIRENFPDKLWNISIASTDKWLELCQEVKKQGLDLSFFALSFRKIKPDVVDGMRFQPTPLLINFK